MVDLACPATRFMTWLNCAFFARSARATFTGAPPACSTT